MAAAQAHAGHRDVGNVEGPSICEEISIRSWLIQVDHEDAYVPNPPYFTHLAYLLKSRFCIFFVLRPRND